jgi:hypothetical protein
MSDRCWTKILDQHYESENTMIGESQFHPLLSMQGVYNDCSRGLRTTSVSSRTRRIITYHCEPQPLLQQLLTCMCSSRSERLHSRLDRLIRPLIISLEVLRSRYAKDELRLQVPGRGHAVLLEDLFVQTG